MLDPLNYRGELAGGTPRAARIVLFYRNELRDYLRAKLAKAGEPLTARELANRLCQGRRKAEVLLADRPANESQNQRSAFASG